MKVFVLIESRYWNYEGGSDEVAGVYTSVDRAFEEVLKRVPQAEVGAESWDLPEKDADDHYLTIQKYDLVE